MRLRLNAAGLTDVGLEREHNEDAIFYLVTRNARDEPVGLFVVADGVGGQLAGELASHWAVASARESLRDLLSPPGPDQTEPAGIDRTPVLAPLRVGTTRPADHDSLRQRVLRAVQAANRTVRMQAQAQPVEAGNAGTTLTMALVYGDVAIIANVGDSRTYLLRGGEMRQVTHDHSLIAGLVASGNVKPEDVYTHPVRNVIVRSLGREAEVEIDLFVEQLHPGDTLLLCSDGLWEMVREDTVLASTIRGAATSMDAARALIDAANAAGGVDNISAIVVRVEA